MLVLLGVAAIGFPRYELINPGQPAPYDVFPPIGGGIALPSVVHAVVLYAGDRTLGERVGSIVADAE